MRYSPVQADQKKPNLATLLVNADAREQGGMNRVIGRGLTNEQRQPGMLEIILFIHK